MYLNTIVEKMSWKKLVAVTVLFLFFYILINFTGIGVAGLLKLSADANILDFEFGYTYEQAKIHLEALGEAGRHFYLSSILPIDFPFPFTYMLFFAGCAAFLLKHIKPKNHFNYLLLVPVLAMLFDWIENIGIILMLKSYASIPLFAVNLASFAGMLKTIFTVLSMGIIAILLVTLLFKKIRSKIHT